jgi:DnaJ-class molecular chaperone
MSESEKTPCTSCQGSGKCFRCNGGGSIVQRNPTPIAVVSGQVRGQGESWRMCPQCHGSGMCPKCKGTGKMN